VALWLILLIALGGLAAGLLIGAAIFYVWLVWSSIKDWGND
jgi:hypothetical protein